MSINYRTVGDECSAATISDDGLYRYDLYRRWGDGSLIAWVGLNPSTADATTDDPTIRRCIGFSTRWGYGGLVMLNVFALRSTDPRALRAHKAPTTPENSLAIAFWCSEATTVVAAWGATYSGPLIDSAIRDATNRRAGDLWCLGVTKAGAPRHPLYVRGDTALEMYLASLLGRGPGPGGQS